MEVLTYTRKPMQGNPHPLKQPYEVQYLQIRYLNPLVTSKQKAKTELSKWKQRERRVKEIENTERQREEENGCKTKMKKGCTTLKLSDSTLPLPFFHPQLSKQSTNHCPSSQPLPCHACHAHWLLLGSPLVRCLLFLWPRTRSEPAIYMSQVNPKQFQNTNKIRAYMSNC